VDVKKRKQLYLIFKNFSIEINAFASAPFVTVLISVDHQIHSSL